MILQDLLEDLRYNIDETEWSINYANELLNSCSNTISLLKTNNFNIDSIGYALPALTREVVTTQIGFNYIRVNKKCGG